VTQSSFTRLASSAQLHTMRVSAISILFILFLTAGCAVLTDSQIQEVNRFSKAAAAYGTLPGEPISQYGSLAKQDRVIDLANTTLGEEGTGIKEWAQLQKALEMENTFTSDSAKLNASLNVITNYAEGLQELTSKEVTDELDKSAEELGTALDKATKQYNEVVLKPQNKKEFGLIGGATAGAIRAAGGLFLSNRQAHYTKDFVTKADPLLSDMMGEIQSLMTRQIDRLTTQEERIQNNFTTLFKRRKQLTPETLLLFSHQLEVNHHAKQLATKANDAAGAFVQAHHALKSALENRKTLTSHIETIETLIQHIKQGLAIKDKVSKS